MVPSHAVVVHAAAEEYEQQEALVAQVAATLSDVLLLLRQPLSLPLPPPQWQLQLDEHKNVFSQLVEVESAQSAEHAYRLLRKGKLVAILLKDPRGLLQMVPTLYKFRNGSLPVVVHVQLPHGHGYAEVMAIRQTGLAILTGLNGHAHERADMALLAHVATLLSNVPVLHVYESTKTDAHHQASTTLVANAAIAQWLELDQDDASSVQSFRDRIQDKCLVQVDHPSGTDPSELLIHQVSPQCTERFHALPDLLQQLLTKMFGDSRSYRLVEYFGAQDATHVVVCTSAVAAILAEAAQDFKAIGVVGIRLLRPWSTRAFLDAFPSSHVQRVAVMDLIGDNFHGQPPLFLDVLQSFQSEYWLHERKRAVPSLVSQNCVSTDRFDACAAKSLLADLLADRLQQGSSWNASAIRKEQSDERRSIELEPSSLSPLCRSVADRQSKNSSTFEAPYVEMLTQLFGQRAVIADLVRNQTVWENDKPRHGLSDHESLWNLAFSLESNPQFGLGVHLALCQKRKQLVDLVQRDLDTIDPVSRLHDCLSRWLVCESKIANDDRVASQVLAEEISVLLSSEEPRGAEQRFYSALYQRRKLFAPLSQWILGSEEWSSDLGASGLHQVLAAGENINVLILDTERYSELLSLPPDKRSKRRKRDIGLYAMQYGNTYVASVALYDSYAQVLRALNEADAFPGPAIVLAYAPLGPNMEQETKRAVDDGYWPLYRYNPRLEGTNERAFVAESLNIKKELRDFLERSNQLSLFAREAVEFGEFLGGSQSLNQDMDAVKRHVLSTSFEKLRKGFKDDQQTAWKTDISLLILVGSDNGHAEELACKLQEEAQVLGIKVTKSDMNELPVDEAATEDNVVFVCSTAGQGEFPSNAREFWKELSTSSASFANTCVAVFGLGDSMYWPREDEKHYFCKAPKDLDDKLVQLGATQLMEVGLGDDQDEDGPSTCFDTWKIGFWQALGVPQDVLAAQVMASQGDNVKLTSEDIKRSSNFLRGTILEALSDKSTKQLPERDTHLTKFHGIYQQDNRDLREQMRQQKQEKAFAFMCRIRVPGGICSPRQYMAVDALSDQYANGNIKITTRQTLQLQGILKWNLKSAIQGINRALMDTLATCGDVNRNTMASVNPELCSVELHKQIVNLSREISTHLSPKTSAYHEIWLDKKLVAGGEVQDLEPMYGDTYLPRKFKIAIAVPPSNDVDVFAHCLGFIAIVDPNNQSQLLGFNVTVGGGMGMTHNTRKTFPRLGDLLGFCEVHQAKEVAEKVLLVQRDYGDRANRKHARFKYTVEDHGLQWIREQIEERLGYKLQPARAFHFDSNNDRFGWHKMSNGKFLYTLFVEGGRVKDFDNNATGRKENGAFLLKTGLRELAHLFADANADDPVHHSPVEFRFTPNQNLTIANIPAEKVKQVKQILSHYGIGNDASSAMRLNSIACAALPFCGLAFAEAERYLPALITKIETILEANGLTQETIGIRMTGCPNGCGRPYLGEIGLVGRSPGIYNLYLGAGSAGERLNKLYKEALDEESILNELEPIIGDFATTRQANERFGDFVIRKGYVKECLAGPLVAQREAGETFHD